MIPDTVKSISYDCASNGVSSWATMSLLSLSSIDYWPGGAGGPSNDIRIGSNTNSTTSNGQSCHYRIHSNPPWVMLNLHPMGSCHGRVCRNTLHVHHQQWRWRTNDNQLGSNTYSTTSNGQSCHYRMHSDPPWVMLIVRPMGSYHGRLCRNTLQVHHQPWRWWTDDNQISSNT